MVLFFFFAMHAACGILVPWPGIEPVSPAVEALSPNHWTAEVPPMVILDQAFWENIYPFLVDI